VAIEADFLVVRCNFKSLPPVSKHNSSPLDCRWRVGLVKLGYFFISVSFPVLSSCTHESSSSLVLEIHPTVGPRSLSLAFGPCIGPSRRNSEESKADSYTGLHRGKLGFSSPNSVALLKLDSLRSNTVIIFFFLSLSPLSLNVLNSGDHPGSDCVNMEKPL
jgi:hypothetical protein